MGNLQYTDKDSEYLNLNPDWHVEDSPWKARQIIKMLNRNNVSCDVIVEIGCGAGEILNQLCLVLPGVNFIGYDISPDAINLAKNRENERIKYFNEDIFNTTQRSELLLVMDVVEHVEDYFGFLRSCKQISDAFILHIPLDISVQTIFRNRLLHPREVVGHIHYFTKETALATLTDLGFNVIDFFYTESSIDLNNTSIKTKTANLFRKLAYKINQDFCVRVFGGYSLLVYAK